MTQLLDIFGFLSVLLRGLTLAFEALTVGGIVFSVIVAPPGVPPAKPLLRWIHVSAWLLGATQICAVAANSAILVGTTDLRFTDVWGAEFWRAGIMIVAGALTIFVFSSTSLWRALCPIAALAIVIGSVMNSHSFARLEHRWILMAVTLIHHLAGAAWIGGLPYLVIALRHASDGAVATAITARFSRLAMSSVALLSGAGMALALIYVGSAGAMVETTYGIMLLAKMILTSIILLFGALNLSIVRAIRRGASPDTLPLRRFAEVEIGIGFTVLLAAASLTSTPPAIDVSADRVSPQQIAQRMKPRWPRLQTPSVAELSPPTQLTALPGARLPAPLVPGQQLPQPNTPSDIAWSEYNHHWAGLVLLTIGILALLSRRSSWARHWPIAFLGLATFLLIRADAENWPLGPRGFWESFQVAEVAQHRLFVLLIVAFAAFEWAVQTNRVAPHRAALVFPMVCAIGGALLLTHSHSLANVQEEFLAELSHIPLAMLAVLAGSSRWLELRLPRNKTQAMAWIWPMCFLLMGAVLILYRES